MTRRILRSGFVMLFLFLHFIYAQKFDFILHNGNQSYRSSIPDQTERTYLDQYMSLYEKNLVSLYRGWANTFTLVGANLPSLGKPPSKIYAGVCLGAGFQQNVDWNDTGYRTQDAEGEGMFDISLFATLPFSTFLSNDNPGLFSNTDITVKLNSMIITITDARMHFSNIGAVMRKQIVQEVPLIGKLVRFSGICCSFGVLYSTASAREDFVCNGFGTDIPGVSEPPEKTVVDETTNGTVIIGAPLDPDTPSYVYYPYIEFQHFSFQSGMKAYVNCFYFFDVFAGANVAFAPINTIYSDVYSDVNVRILDDQGLDSHYDGRMTIQGSTRADHFILMGVFGMQFNFGPVKVPIEMSASPATQTVSINTGIFVSF